MLRTFALALVLLSSLTNPVTQAYLDFPICSTSGNFNSTSSFLLNLNKLLSSLPSNAVTNDWFFNDTVDATPGEQAYGLAMCHYDTSNTPSCMTCLIDVARNIVLKCPYSTNAVLWYDECFIRYSNQSFFSIPSEDSFFFRNQNGAEDPQKFNLVVGDLMNKLTMDVATSSKLVAIGEANYTAYQKIYALVECTRDLSPLQCKQCVQQEVGFIPVSCPAAVGCKRFGASCYMRYEVYSFYNPISPPSPPPVPLPLPSPPTKPISSQGTIKVNSYSGMALIKIVIAVAGSTLAILFIGCAVRFYLRIRIRRTIGTGSNVSSEPNLGGSNFVSEEVDFSMGFVAD